MQMLYMNAQFLQIRLQKYAIPSNCSSDIYFLPCLRQRNSLIEALAAFILLITVGGKCFPLAYQVRKLIGMIDVE